MKNIYKREYHIREAIISFFGMNFFWVLIALVVGFDIITIFPIILSTFICLCFGLDSILFRRKRNLAMSNPPVTTGEIIGYRIIPHYGRYNGPPNASLYIRLEDGRITETPQIKYKLLSQIISEKVNLYRHKKFFYIGDIVCIPYDEYPDENDENSDNQPVKYTPIKLPMLDLETDDSVYDLNGGYWNTEM